MLFVKLVITVITLPLGVVLLIFVVIISLIFVVIISLPLMQHLDRPGVSFCTRTTYDDNAITNAVEIYASPRYLFSLSRRWNYVAFNVNLSGVCFLNYQWCNSFHCIK